MSGFMLEYVSYILFNFYSNHFSFFVLTHGMPKVVMYVKFILQNRYFENLVDPVMSFDRCIFFSYKDLR